MQLEFFKKKKKEGSPQVGPAKLVICKINQKTVIWKDKMIALSFFDGPLKPLLKWNALEAHIRHND